MKKYILLFIGMFSILMSSASSQFPPSPLLPPQEYKSLTIQNNSTTTIYCSFYNKDASLVTKTEEINPNRRLIILRQPTIWKNVATVSIFQTTNKERITCSFSSENSLIIFTEDKGVEIK